MILLSTKATRVFCATALILACIIFRDTLEADPVTHVIVQLPALVWSGWLIAGAITVRWWSRHFSDINVGGVAALSVAAFGAIYWMLPKSIDGALTSSTMEAAKFVSVPLLIGVPLRSGWRRAPALLRGILKANFLSMLGVLAWLYTAAPIRICNNYLVDDQIRLGTAFLIVGLGLAIVWSERLLFGSSKRQRPGPVSNSLSEGNLLP